MFKLFRQVSILGRVLNKSRGLW